MTEKEADGIRARILVRTNGTPEKQVQDLVQAILESFQDPGKWPMTDKERILLLRRLYEKARRVRQTEDALKAE